MSVEERKALFDSYGGLTEAAIRSSRQIIRIESIKNQALLKELSSRPGNLSDWGKYETEPVHTPSGLARVHFYYNSVTGEVCYGRDYKALFDHQGRWDGEGSEPIFSFDP